METMLLKEVTLYLMGALYVFAGLMHFIKPKFYLRIMPPYVPFHRAMVAISGVIEIDLASHFVCPCSRAGRPGE